MISFLIVRSQEHVAEVARLAREIWLDHYVPIVGRKQVDYMLEKFQSKQALEEQLSDAWYLRMGFRKSGPIIQDIGGGFVMDDFRMEKSIGRQ